MPLYIEEFEWLDWVVEKIATKHSVSPEEVEEAFFNSPQQVLRAGSGKLKLLGRADSGRYLMVVFVLAGRSARIITARHGKYRAPLL